MMTLIYRIILAGIVALIGWDLFTEENLRFSSTPLWC